MYIHTASNTVLSDLAAVCRWLVRTHNVARPENAADLPDIMTEAGVVPYTPEPPTPTADEIKAALVLSVQVKLDRTAAARGYDGILSACSYDGDPNPVFAAEATAFKAFRSAAWTHCYTVLADVQGGRRGIPTPEELVAELPALVL